MGTRHGSDVRPVIFDLPLQFLGHTWPRGFEVDRGREQRSRARGTGWRYRECVDGLRVNERNVSEDVFAGRYHTLGIDPLASLIDPDVNHGITREIGVEESSDARLFEFHVQIGVVRTAGVYRFGEPTLCHGEHAQFLAALAA